MKLIVVGGVAAGMSAASKLKRTKRNAQVTVYEKGQTLSYGACGLPYYVSGEISDHTKMIARTKEEFEASGMDIFTQHEVVKVDSEKKQVLVRDTVNQNMFIDWYDKLIISSGTQTILPPITGIELNGIYTLKTLEDGVQLEERVSSQDIEDVVVVGAGYIGVEVAEAMAHLGKNVRIIELSDRILQGFEPEIVEIAEREIQENGVQLNLNEKVEEFVGGQHIEEVKTDKGIYKADLVVMAVGVKPTTDFLKGSGISLADNGAVIIDREMKTNIEGIFAAGDCAEVYNKVMEENSYIPLGTNANKCGRIAGGNIAGERHKYVGTLGSAATRVFNLEMGRTGMTEQDAQALALDYDTVFVETSDHASYYPGQTPIWIKLIYTKQTKRVIGAHAIGQKGVVLRINTFAVAIHNEMSTEELGMVDLCYAPPFSNVWDAIHIASNAAK